MSRKCTKLWTQSDGTKIRICDMSDGHLRNTIRFLERKLKDMQDTMPEPCFQGELAQLYAEREYEAFMEADPGDIWPIYYDLVEDAGRRSLTML